ncbi:hypothetical protein [Pedobacter sp.]|uniref:hypothetical protein n=1 Tax=Pedobacter sp. TaxID=1411316 RepID=UPI003D7F7147
MATSDEEGNFRGSVGKLIYRNIKGKTIIQSKPAPGITKQTAATNASKIDFSLGSNRAKIMRYVLFPMLNGKHDAKMINRFNTAVGDVVRSNTALQPGFRDLEDGDMALLNGFEFNMNSPFASMLGVKLTMTQSFHKGVTISLPTFEVKEDLVFPDMAAGVVLRVLISALNLQRNEYQYCGYAELNIPLGSVVVPKTEWSFLEMMPDQCLFLASCSLDYYGSGLYTAYGLNSVKLHPVTIIGLQSSQEFEFQLPGPQDETDLWHKWMPIPGADGNKYLNDDYSPW